MDDQRSCLSELFEELYTVNSPDGELLITGIQRVDANPTIIKAALTPDEFSEAMARMRYGKTLGGCKISPELFEAGDEDMMRELYVVLINIWHSGILHDWKTELVASIWLEKRDRQECKNYRSNTLLTVSDKMLTHPSFIWIRSQLPMLQRPEQSGFTRCKSTFLIPVLNTDSNVQVGRAK